MIARRPGLFTLVSSLVLFAFAAEFAAAQPCAPNPPGLVAWWKLDSNPADVLGAHNGVAIGGSFVPAEVLSGFRPGGLNSLVVVADSPALNPTTFTLDCWAKLESPPAVTPSLVWKGDQPGIAPTSPFGLGIYDTTQPPGLALRPFVTIGNGVGFQELDGSITVPIGQFFHLAATADGTTLSLYLDGVLVGSAPQILTPAASSYPLQIGGIPAPGGLNPGPDIIDEVELHNLAATPAQILAIYVAGSSGKCLGATPAAGPTWGSLKQRYR